MLKGRHIVLVEDDEIMGGSIYQRLRLEGAVVHWVKQVARAVGAIRTPGHPVDAVVCDIRLPDGSGEDLFFRLSDSVSLPPFLFVTGHGGVDQAVRLMRAGAADYIQKPFEMSAFLQRLSLLVGAGSSEIDHFVGISAAATAVEDLVRRAAQVNQPAMIRGEHGTGKGRIARALHGLSADRAQGFHEVDFAKQGASLIFDRLMPDAEGTALVGSGGTIFLNALARMPREAQDRLAEALERDPLRARLISACGREMDQALADGAFRADLFYKLDVIDIPVPPFRDRPDDAIWLMMRLFEAKNADRDPPLAGISARTEEAMRAHVWPGNGRELRSRVIRGLEMARGTLLMPADVFPDRPEVAETRAELPSLATVRDAAERRQILLALETTGGQVGEAARLLQVSRTTLWEKMQKLGI
ncbi:MAG: response regulator [Rhodobacteraceae bacterium]|nr:response regulator [Paracoccaceae bacterium]